MAVTSKIKQNKQVSLNVPSIKMVLAPPFTISWPEIPQDFMSSVKEELLSSTFGMKMIDIKPKWSELSKFSKEKRSEKRQQLMADHLNNLSLEEREKFDTDESVKQSKWKHLVHGYNNVTRLLGRNELIGVLVKRNVTPEILGLGIVPACFAKNIPLLAFDDLDVLLKNDDSLGVRHSIMVLGLRKSVVESIDCVFTNLYSQMKNAWDSKLATENTILAETIEVSNKRSGQMSHCAKRKTKKSLPKVDVKKFLLTRSSSSERVFMNDLSMHASEDFLSLARSSHPVIKSFNKTEDNQPSVPIKTEDYIKPDLDFDFNSDFFSFDTGTDDTANSGTQRTKSNKKNNKTKGLKRKLSSSYIPAAVVKMKANIHKKKKK